MAYVSEPIREALQRGAQAQTDLEQLRTIVLADLKRATDAANHLMGQIESGSIDERYRDGMLYFTKKYNEAVQHAVAALTHESEATE